MAVATRRKLVQQDDDGSTRDRILDVALTAFSELGFDGASTRTIATRAGVNQGLISYYFGSKQALWREAVDRAFAEMQAEIPDLWDPSAETGARERLEALIRQAVRFTAHRPDFTRLMSDESRRGGERMRWIVDRHVRTMFEVIQNILKGSLGATRLPADTDPVILHYILLGATTQLYHHAPECKRVSRVDPSDEAVIEAHADTIVALFLR